MAQRNCDSFSEVEGDKKQSPEGMLAFARRNSRNYFQSATVMRCNDANVDCTPPRSLTLSESVCCSAHSMLSY